jgi:hypothetical protein
VGRKDAKVFKTFEIPGIERELVGRKEWPEKTNKNLRVEFEVYR